MIAVTTEVLPVEQATVAEPVVTISSLFSARTWKIPFEPPAPYAACNPCPVYLYNAGEWWCSIRAVDYRLGTPSERSSSKNYLARLAVDNFELLGVQELVDRSGRALNARARTTGFEDLRLVEDTANPGELVAYATACDVRNGGGTPEMMLLVIDKKASEIVEADVLRGPWSRFPQKNWTPCADDHNRVLYRAYPPYALDVSDLEFEQETWLHGRDEGLDEHDFVSSSVRGSSQAVPFDGGYLVIVHEHKTKKPLSYVHRFLWLDDHLVPRRVSKEFVWNAGGVEFCCGMSTADGETLVAGFGVHDREAHLAVFQADRVRQILRDLA